MLVFYFTERPDMKTRLEELVGKERLAQIESRLSVEQERLQFEFESLGQDEAASAAALLDTIERATLEEEMKSLKEQLYRVEGNESVILTKRLMDLKRRQQELRK